MTIQPGDIALHHDGTLARVIFPPTERDLRMGVAFWIDDKVFQMAWAVEWCEDVVAGEAAPGHEWEPVQMALFEMERAS